MGHRIHRGVAVGSALLIAAGASSAFAQSTTQPGSAAQPSGMPATAAESMTFGRHSIDGEVKKVDREKGQLDLETRDGKTLELQFPSAALRNVKEGDRLTVDLSLRPNVGPAASPATTVDPPDGKDKGESK